MSEVAKTSILRMGLPAPLHQSSQLVTDPSAKRPHQRAVAQRLSARGSLHGYRLSQTVGKPINFRTKLKPSVDESATVSPGPPRRYAAAQQDGGYRAYRVAVARRSREPSRAEALRTPAEHRPSLPSTHTAPEHVRHGRDSDSRLAEISDMRQQPGVTLAWVLGHNGSTPKTDRRWSDAMGTLAPQARCGLSAGLCFPRISSLWLSTRKSLQCIVPTPDELSPNLGDGRAGQAAAVSG